VKIAVLGTGSVGRTMAARFATIGHDVTVGTRDVQATLTRSEPDAMGNPPFSTWAAGHSQVPLLSFAEAAANAELVVNATNGGVSIEVLTQAGADNLAGKVLLDIANPLDFSQGFPPTLFVKDTDSLGEQIQRAYPDVKVVKALNTMNTAVMVDPTLVPAPHDVFIAGNDADAKRRVAGLLGEWFGWTPGSIIDVGDITAARGTEMMLPVWLRLWQALGTNQINFHIARAGV